MSVHVHVDVTQVRNRHNPLHYGDTVWRVSARCAMLIATLRSATIDIVGSPFTSRRRNLRRLEPTRAISRIDVPRVCPTVFVQVARTLN